MEPPIQYARTSDGVNIAYFVMGEGMPLIITPPLLFSHLQLELDDPGYRRWDEAIACGKQLIRYDHRGSGLSDRDVELDPMSLEQDIGAVADRLGLETFALSGTHTGALPAIAYAAHHPERVSHLVLWCAPSKSTDIASPTPVNVALFQLRETDWRMYLTFISHALVAGLSSSSDAAGFSEIMYQSTDRARASAALDWDYDLTSMLPAIRCPTLVVHRKECTLPGSSVARYLASQISSAELVMIEGGAILPWVGDMDSAVSAFNRFLGVTAPPVAPSAGATPTETPQSLGGTAIILFADIVDSTGLTERMGDAAFRERARALDASLRAIITKAHGNVIDAKTLGDGVLATFPGAAKAIDAALRCVVAGNEQSLPLHLGLHAGDVIREQNNVFGGAVNIASRISGLSTPGEVLVSRTVADLARTSAGVTFEDRGEHVLKGVADPQRVFSVRIGAG